MITDILKRSAAGLVTAAVAIALVLGLPADTEGQQSQQQLQLTKGELETSLENPDQVIQKLEQERGMKAITFVGIGDVLQSDQEVQQLQQQHSQGSETFREALRGDNELFQNVQSKLQEANYQVEDVIAIHVASRANPSEGEAGEQEQQEMAAHEVVYVVVPGTLYPGTPGTRDTTKQETARTDTATGQPPQDSLPR